MNKFTLDTEHYEFHVRPKFELKKEFHSKRVTCVRCSGQGKTGGGFKSLDDPEDCYYCAGTGYSWKHVLDVVPEPPKIPEDYIEHMKAAHKAYLELKQKQKEQHEKINRITRNSKYGITYAHNAKSSEYTKPSGYHYHYR